MEQMADPVPPVPARPASRSRLEQESPSLPIVPGDTGEAVADIQQRLAELGIEVGEPYGSYGPSTESALRGFQSQRGLRESGSCDQQTWDALVESGRRLGERMLYRRTPMQRGDDVAELQHRLSSLGFDPGRIDGIFGDETATALRDFQRNSGLLADGIFGRHTLAELRRLSPRQGGGDLVSPLRERLNVSRSGEGDLEERRIAVAEPGGFAAAIAALCRALRQSGATAIELRGPDSSELASEANRVGADCVVALTLAPERDNCTVAYYRGFRYESAASRRLAELLAQRLPAEIGLEAGGTIGMALPILRETRMPAVELQLGRPLVVVQKTPVLARLVVESLVDWVRGTWD